MIKYKIISVDMYQTLVNLDHRIHNVWKPILGDNFSSYLANQYATELDKLIVGFFNEQHLTKDDFENVEAAFVTCFDLLFRKHDIDFDPKEAARRLKFEHSLAVDYDDVQDFFKAIGDQAPICLVSDADMDMIESILERFNFDITFVSEKERTYKSDPSGEIFQKVIDHYQVKPDEVIHIGDGMADMKGASSVGISTCWINRYNKEYKHTQKPNYTVKNLLEVIPLLGLK